ncbi:hypothetical protein [Mycobacterium tilburgii]|uniref:hypothetical protein n=1 Tax=Mycobacterium tilburgii TaxID=44467 RepID=UPI00118344CA|nr:hypothetical protein [Mycobacterium tilburgii]
MAQWAITARTGLPSISPACRYFHVVAQSRNNEVIYSDGLTWPGAEGFAADLISPAPSAPVPEVELEAVWIVKAVRAGARWRTATTARHRTTRSPPTT